MPSYQERYRPLLEAVAFAARVHQGQLRKDQKTPYSSHPFRVCLIVREVFGYTDTRMLLAALLHDTIEDTTTDFDDLEETFGLEVAQWVSALTKEKRLQHDDRESSYLDVLAQSPWQVKACKLADLFDNLMDSKNLTPEQRGKGVKKWEVYYQHLKKHAEQELEKPLKIVGDLLEEIKSEPEH